MRSVVRTSRPGHHHHVAAAGILFLGVGWLAVPSALASGTVSLTSLGTAYTQDFDVLATSGTANTTLPTGWDLLETGTSARNNAAYAASTGSDTAGDVYSFGPAGNADRAFGTLRSGTLAPTVGGSFTNSTGATITSLTISYTGEQWRAGITNRNAADRLDFQWSTDATSLSTDVWSDEDSLDFATPNIATSSGAKDGNDAANRGVLSHTLTGLSIVPGASFWIRWTDFDISSSDDGLGIDDFALTPLGTVTESAPSVSSTTPIDGTLNVQVDAALTVEFSEPVDVTDPWFTLDCVTSGAHDAVVTGGPTTFTLDPTVDFLVNESCTLTIVAANVSDQDANDPPDTLAGNVQVDFSTFDECSQAFTPIPQIQGGGLSTPLSGSVVTTRGVVVGDYEYPGSGTSSDYLRGFYLQDADGDADPATSDGLFVFNGNNNSVDLGDIVFVTGTATEFQDQTQIASVTSVTRCGTGSVTPVDVTLPVADATFLERYEGMLVRLPQPLSVTEHFQLGRFGQVVVSSGARLPQPTSIVEPGVPALEVQNQNNLNRIIVDDASQAQNPDPILFGRLGNPLSAGNTLRGGDTVTGLVGVLTYNWAGNSASGNAYRVRPINALGAAVPDFQPANPRPASAPPAAGTLRVVGINLLNYFNTFDGCTLGVGGALTDCRGADDAAEFARQWPKTVAAILAMNPDILGLNELENDGYGPGSAIQSLVDQLNAEAGAGTWDFIDADAGTSQSNALGTDAIKVGLLYKPAVVTPVGQTAALNTTTFINGGDGAERNRASLAQAFEVESTGAVLVVDVNHLKSKGSACDLPDQGDGQGNCSMVRTNAALALASWLAGDPTGTEDPDVLLIGDYNSYAKEDPIAALEDAGYTNLVAQLLGADAYSYVFDGQWGYLDHVLASDSLVLQVDAVHEFHIDADEPRVLDYNVNFKSAGQVSDLYAADEFRASDHDPVIVDLTLEGPPPADCGNDIVEPGEQCDPPGTCCSATCQFETSGSACGNGDDTACNAPDTCDGSGACVDRKKSNGVVCLTGSGTCDPDDTCDGTTDACAPVVAAAATACGDGDDTACNAPDTCDGSGACVDRKKSIGVVCLSGSGTCDPEDTCDGTTDVCAPVMAAPATACGDDDDSVCNAPDTCDGSGACVDRKKSTGVVCLAGSGTCDPDDTCDGTTDACSPLMAAPATPCDDGDLCTVGDTCDGTGACFSGDAPDCDDGEVCTQDGCDPDTGDCLNVPEPRFTTADIPAGACKLAQSSSLLVSGKDEGGQIKWAWARGEDVDKDLDLGNPTVDTSYTLCIYDSCSGVYSLPVDDLGATFPEDSVEGVDVGPGSGWTDLAAKGYRYKATGSCSQDGWSAVQLKPGTGGSSAIVLKANGDCVPVPEPASAEQYMCLDPEVVVQLVNSEGACFSSSFDTALKNTPKTFKARTRLP